MYLINMMSKSLMAAAASEWIVASFRSGATATGMWYGLLATTPASRR